MQPVTRFQCSCGAIRPTEEAVRLCELADREAAEIKRLEEEITDLQQRVTLHRRDVVKAREAADAEIDRTCRAAGGHYYQPTGNTRSGIDVSDTRYTSEEERCSNCGLAHWT